MEIFLLLAETCEIFDTTAKQWSYTGDLNTGRTLAYATVLKNGKVLITGGRIDWSAGAPLSTAVTEIYDPATGKWHVIAPLNSSTQEAPGVLFSTGQAMICGGWSGTKPLNTTELYTDSLEYSDVIGIPLTKTQLLLQGWKYNAASGQLLLLLNIEEANRLSIRVYNVIGQKLLSERHSCGAGVQQIKLDLNAFSKGFYFLRIVSADGNVNVREKILL